MITAILDTNVLVQALLTSHRTAPARTLDACLDGRFQLVYSPAILDEWLQVLTVDHIRARHGLTDDELTEFVTSLLVNAVSYPGEHTVSATLTRDVTDTKFLSVAHEAAAKYLVTNDRRHLLRLKHYQTTRIVTPTQFLRHLP